MCCLISIYTSHANGLFLNPREAAAAVLAGGLFCAPYMFKDAHKRSVLGVNSHFPGMVITAFLMVYLLKKHKDVDLTNVYPVLLTSLIVSNQYLRRLPFIETAPTPRLAFFGGLFSAALFKGWQQGW